MKVYRPTEGRHCQFEASEHGELVYDRERDTKPKYNGKVVCIDLNGQNMHDYTVGKIYQFKDGCLITDDGYRIENKAHPFRTFEDWAKFSHSKWLEIKE